MQHSDNHSHIILASIESMVEAAKKADVSILCTTEHISQFDFMREKVKFASIHESGRMFSSFDEYLKEFEKIRIVDGIRVKKGLEVDFINEYKKEIGDQVSKRKWDILLCSVHELAGGVDIEHKKLPRDLESSHKRWKVYIETQKRAILSDFIPFDVLTHPVRLGLRTPAFPNDLDDMMRDLAAVAREKGKALELNGADLARTPDLVRKVAEACKKAGCKVSYGSDSHYPDQVSRNYTHASELIKEFGLEVI